MRLFRSDRWPAVQQTEPDVMPCHATRQYQLDSVLPATHFAAVFHAEWLPMGQGHDAIVFRSLSWQANAITRRFSVLNAEEANDELTLFLATARLPADSGIRLKSARATLSVAQEDREFAARQAMAARQADADVAGLAAKHAYLMRLRDLFLSDGATARLWWSDGDRDRILRLPKEGDQLDAVVGLITKSPEGAVQPDKIAPLVASFLEGLGVGHRTYLIGQLTQIFENYHRPDLAEELRRSEPNATGLSAKCLGD